MKTAFCRDCLQTADHLPAERRCSACGSPRILRHDELSQLSIAHLDCDAFYAAIEKRDDPSLEDKPLIIGGGRRGVVSTACYIARIYGVHSAQPMFKALEACPDAIVMRPDMQKYAAVGREVRALMEEATPLVQPISIDEAFLDLTGTERLHKRTPAETMAALVLRIEKEIGITVSVGLSYNKFLAKLASDLDKPRGFAVIGRGEAIEFLKDKPVSMIWGVGKAMQKRLEADGVTRIGHLQNRDETDLMARYGAIGQRLARFSMGRDERKVTPLGAAKSISAETTMSRDIASYGELESILWPLCEKVATRAKRSETVGRTVVLKLKTADFQILTRSRTLSTPTQLADTIFTNAQTLLRAETTGTRYRLIGVGISSLEEASERTQLDMLDAAAGGRAGAERAIDVLRARFGPDSIVKGRGLHKSAGREAQGQQPGSGKPSNRSSDPDSENSP